MINEMTRKKDLKVNGIQWKCSVVVIGPPGKLPSKSLLTLDKLLFPSSLTNYSLSFLIIFALHPTSLFIIVVFIFFFFFSTI